MESFFAEAYWFPFVNYSNNWFAICSHFNTWCSWYRLVLWGITKCESLL